ncbi:MAG: (d)CMP kinase [Acidobacteria bacterium]|nr:(d)CMP kinase [Acidobacteriota bacterium]
MTPDSGAGDGSREPCRLIIAIDGPSAAGKSTISRLLARRLGLQFINTGAMYRAVAYKASRSGVDVFDTGSISRLADQSNIELKGDPDDLRIFCDGEDVTRALRSPEVSRLSSIVSAVPGVRRAMVAAQRKMGERGGVVLEGRDIGTQVFPQADYKFFLVADPEVRARRRWEEERTAGHELTFDQLRSEIDERDRRDETRGDSPLRRASDAILIDSSKLTIEEVVEQILERIRPRS